MIAQFLSYMWGGYTAGRMGRGAGLVNGFLVPVVALIVAAVVAAAVLVIGARLVIGIRKRARASPFRCSMSWKG